MASLMKEVLLKLKPLQARIIAHFVSTNKIFTTPTQNILLHRRLCSTKPLSQKQTVTIYFVLPNGEKREAKAKLGDSLLDVVIENKVDIDGYGACEGTLACSTCHLIFPEAQYKSLPDKPTDEELDMLDLAYGLTDTSRLGCQIIVTKDMDGWQVAVPKGIADARN